jgi:ketosteroid isomerase-like protein
MRRAAAICIACALLFVACASRQAVNAGAVTGFGSSAVTSPTGNVISAAWRSHIDAAKRKDLAGVIAIYADSILYVVPGMEPVRGRAAVESMEASGLSSADVLNAQHTLESLYVAGNTAYEIGTIAGPVQLHGQAARTVTFHYMAMWELQSDGSWRIRQFSGKPE